MNCNKTGVYTASYVTLAAWLLYLFLSAVAPVQAQYQEVIQGGEIEYHKQCAVCHGSEGRGDGSMVQNLVVKPADLTQVALRNGGVFPFWRVYRIIDGRELVRGHGSREMPVWGRRFQERDSPRRTTTGDHGQRKNPWAHLLSTERSKVNW